MTFKLRSYTEEEVIAALENCSEVWALDTGNDGEDDTLIGSYAEVLRDVLAFHEMEELPSHWSLEKIIA